MIVNKLTGTSPKVFHAPGLHDRKRNALFDNVCNFCFAQPPVVANDITVMVCCNKWAPCILERLLIKNGQPHVILGKHIRDWNHGWKHSLYLEHLPHVKTPYVMGLDGLDLTYYGDLREGIELLQTLDKDWLFNGDYEVWPCWPMETPRVFANYQKEISDPNSPWRYINAGAWIAKTDFALETVKHSRAVADRLRDITEQMAYHYLFPAWPRMGIDYQCKFFQTELRDEILVMPAVNGTLVLPIDVPENPKSALEIRLEEAARRKRAIFSRGRRVLC